MKPNRRWLVFANNEKCNHGRAFAEQGFVSWNPHSRKFAVGDTVFLFFSRRTELFALRRKLWKSAFQGQIKHIGIYLLQMIKPASCSSWPSMTEMH